MNFKNIFIGLTTTLLASSVFAGEFITLDLNDQVYRTRMGNDTIPLKRTIRQQHPGIQLQGKDLLSVILVAKSARGFGQAELKIGQNFSDPQTINGNIGDFQSNAEASFDRLLFKNESSQSNGRWQIKLRGRIKVSQVVVEIAEEESGWVEATIPVHQHLRGQNTVMLKRLLRQQGFDPSLYNLYFVEASVKSRHGMGQVALRIGPDVTSSQAAPGSPGTFQSDAPGTFSKLLFAAPSPESLGPWQLKTQGNIKISTVKLYMTLK